MKNNKSRKSDKRDDTTSQKSKTSKFGFKRSGLKQASVSGASS